MKVNAGLIKGRVVCGEDPACLPFGLHGHNLWISLGDFIKLEQLMEIWIFFAGREATTVMSRA